MEMGGPNTKKVSTDSKTQWDAMGGMRMAEPTRLKETTWGSVNSLARGLTNGMHSAQCFSVFSPPGPDKRDAFCTMF